MERFFALLVLCAAFVPCSATMLRRPLLPASEEVRSIAEQYVDSLAKPTPPEQINQARADFIWFFLKGFTNSEGVVSGSNDAVDKGFGAGQTYRRENPEKLNRTMSGFGYTAINLRGTWQTEFELSGFVPDSQPKAMWWLSILGDSPAAESDISAEQCPDVQIVGFLSPAGHYGHMGVFTQEIYVYEISCVRANNSFKPKPLRGSA